MGGKARTSRFEHLEERHEAEPREAGVDARRFAAPPDAKNVAPEGVSPDPTERDAQAPPGAGPDAPAEDADTPAFHSCAHCGAVNGRYDKRCFNCRANLTTPEQQAHALEAWHQHLDARRSAAADEAAAAAAKASAQEAPIAVAQPLASPRVNRLIAVEQRFAALPAVPRHVLGLALLGVTVWIIRTRSSGFLFLFGCLAGSYWLLRQLPPDDDRG